MAAIEQHPAVAAAIFAKAIEWRGGQECVVDLTEAARWVAEHFEIVDPEELAGVMRSIVS